MKKEVISTLHKSFEEYVHIEEGVEFWLARDLQKLLEYKDWRNFSQVVDKAITACNNSGNSDLDHFVDVNNMVAIGSSTIREVEDKKLTRYACYLVAQNGDPRKEEIAFAQTYFAVQTRKQEVIEERLKELKRLEKREYLAEQEKRFAGIIFERGVDSKGFARIKSKGDEKLFGGNTTKMMKDKLSVPPKRALADFLPTITLTAKALVDEMTEINVLSKDLQGENPISKEHNQSNSAVRKALMERGIVPEDLPAGEDIKLIERRVKAEGKKLAGSIKRLG